MITALQYLEKLNRIDVLLSAQVAIEETASTAVKVQREQLAQGLNRFEKPITNQKTGSDEYSPVYAKKKGRKKPIDLRLTGDYYAGMGIDVRGDLFVMFSGDIKATMLENNYDALGINRTGRIEWIKELKPALVKEIKTYLK